MTNKNKAKGNTYERTLVNRCKDKGLDARRSWGSDGRSMGEAKEVDCLIEGYKVQCKKGYNHPSIKLDEFMKEVDFCVWGPSDGRSNRNSDYVFMSIDMFIEILIKLKDK